MVYNYKRKTKRGEWSLESLQQAKRTVSSLKLSLRAAAVKYGIPKSTLQRRLKKKKENKDLGRFKTVFTAEQEELLAKHVRNMDRLFYGLTIEGLQKLAYQFAAANKIPNPFVRGEAGRGWTHGFMQRHPDLSLRTPESTSVARAVGFNRPQVDRFFALLRSMYIKHGLRAQDIFNCDEAGIQTSGTRPPKVISVRGKRQVGVVSSAEKGKTVTALCCCSATGVFIPPALIFPRKRMIDRLLDGTPPGTIGMCSDSGWINTELFLQWLQFFIEQVKPSEERPVLLVLDNHESHRAFSVIEKASENHVILLSVPPHTTHKLQPLDRTVYGPFSTYFQRETDQFQKDHPAWRIQMTDMGAIFGKAYSKACSVENAVKGFKKCGIAPYDANVFTDEDFAPASVTDRDMPNQLSVPTAINPMPNAIPVGNTPVPIAPTAIASTNQPDPPPVAPVMTAHVPNPTQHLPQASSSSPQMASPADTPLIDELMFELNLAVPSSPVPSLPSSAGPVNVLPIGTTVTSASSKSDAGTDLSPSSSPAAGPSGVSVLPVEILPLPKSVQPVTTRKRRTQHSEILTSSPFIRLMKEKELEKKEKMLRKKDAAAKKAANKKAKGKGGPKKKTKKIPN